MSNAVTLKRRNSEIWSTFRANYDAFSTSLVDYKVAAIKDALIGAVEQIPDKTMPVDMKAAFVAAAERGGERLIAERGRYLR